MSRLLLIGEGIAAAAYLRELSVSRVAEQFTRIVQVASPDLAPACSFHSTAVAALRGTRTGLSPLGDELVAGWEMAREFYQSWDGPGVTAARLTTVVEDTEKDLRRFSHLPRAVSSPLPLSKTSAFLVEEEAWLIDPALFLPALHSSLTTPPRERRETLVTRLHREGPVWRARFLGGMEEDFERVVLASGAWMPWMRELFPPGHPLGDLRPVQGSYWQWEGVDLGPESFAMAWSGHNLVYHAVPRRLLMGATSVKDGTLIPDLKGLRGQWEFWRERLERPLPDPARALLRTGVRARTADRRPHGGGVREGLQAMGGLYKNGWVAAWKLARDLLDDGDRGG